MPVYVPKIDRRTALKWMSAAMIAMAVAPKMARAATYVKTPNGYGTDPDMLNPTAPWDRIMTDRQLQIAAAMTDIILPEEAPHPLPSQIGVPDFINEWVSSPYEQTQDDKATILAGLDRIDAEAKKRFGQGYVECGPDKQATLMAEIAAAGEDGQGKFFQRFRALTLGGYYTTPAGFEDIGYIGNVPMETYPGPSESLKTILDERMKAIGI